MRPLGLPMLAILRCSKPQGILLQNYPVLLDGSRTPHPEGLERMFLRMDARAPKLGLPLSPSDKEGSICWPWANKTEGLVEMFSAENGA